MRRSSVRGWHSLRVKTLLQTILFSLPLLLFGFLNVQQTRQVSIQIDTLLVQSTAISSTLREALAKLAEAGHHARNNDREAFEASASHFDLLMKALAWGTDSAVFQRDYDGELRKQWAALGWQRSIGSVDTSEKMRQFAGETSLYYRGFTKYMLKVMGPIEGSEEEKRASSIEMIKKASQYERQVIQNLRGLMDEVRQTLIEDRATVDRLQFEQMRRLFSLACLLFLIMAASAWVISYKDIVKPITELILQVDSIRSGDLEAKLPLNSKDEIGALAKSFNEMTEDLQKVTVSRDYMNSVLDVSPIGFFLTNVEGDCQYVNRVYSKISGLNLEKALGKGWSSAIHEDDRERVFSEWYQAVSEKRNFESFHRFIRPDGTTVSTHVIATPIVTGDKVTGYVGAVEDITERMRFEDAVRQSEKMSAVGQLAGGIAHDLNNGLTPVMGYLDMMLLDASEQNAVLLNEAKQSTQRCADVVRQLLNFSRPATQARAELSVARLCEEFKRLAHTILPPAITVTVECAPDAGAIEANETDIMNVLMNLAINAKDAMQSNGKLTVKASRVEADHAKISEANRNVSGQKNCVLISMSDTGKGIPPDVISRIFEPFFTTKTKGKGTGLGLAMVYNSVKEHGGWIDVLSIEGKGTTFQVYLPLSSGQTAADPSKTVKESTQLPPGEGVVLLVDDEEMLRSMGKRFLERAGYSVLLAADGTDAVQVFSKNFAEIKAVVMDITMPKMSGIEAMKKILAIDPKARIILVSGYTSEGTPQELVKAGAAAFLAKPYMIGPLVSTIQRVLAGRP